MRSHLVIPDSHAIKDDNFRRFEAVGNYIAKNQPEVIINLGDAWDMPSLSRFDEGKKDFVFKNVADDIEAGHKAEALMFGPMIELNKKLAKAKAKQYDPVIVKILGNHEFRVKKLLEYEPRWDGSVSMASYNTRLPIKEVVVPYMDWIEIDGVFYSHVFVSGVMGRGVPNAKVMLQKKSVSCSMGHTHILDIANTTKPDGTRINGLIAGCLLDPDYRGFGGPQVDRIYWSGIIMKHGVENGDYDIETINIKRLLKDYLDNYKA